MSLAFFALLFATLTSRAQNSFDGNFIPFSLGGSYQVFIDEFNSPLIYSGLIGLSQTGFVNQNGYLQHNLYINGGAGFQRPELNRDENLSRYTTYLARIHYSIRYKLWQKQMQSFFAGIVSHNTWDYRLHNRFGNSAETFTGLFSYGLSASYQREFDFKIWGKKPKHIGFQFDLNLPIASYVLRPAYVNQTVADEIGFTKNLLVGDFFHINTQAHLVYFLKNGNQLRLSYNWDYASIAAPNYTLQAEHQLFISTYFNF